MARFATVLIGIIQYFRQFRKSKTRSQAVAEEAES